ncbi:LacI family DNA-binding transcriptional regulator [Brucellaceae bacterium C25G]
MDRSKTLKQKDVTIKDVARVAEVSAMTVSNVLNGSGRVSEATAARIRAVIEQLGYRPSVAARRLRLSRQWTIGMLIIVEDPDFLSDPFITAQITGLTNYLTANSYSLILRGMKPSDFQTSGMFQDIEADGMVALLSGSEEQRDLFVKELSNLNVPLILLEEHKPRQDMDCISICQNDEEGGYLIAKHLLNCGARHMWTLMPSAHWPAIKARVTGVQRALEEASVSIPDVVDCGDESYDFTYAAVFKALQEKERPDAIIGGNDQMAIAAMKACKDYGLRVPDDIQITGFNGFDIWRYVDPVLTTVRSAAHALGECAGRELIRRLHEGHFSQQEIILPVVFQQGNSTR